jgi:prepilin-type N-terminal cleavage/methylation domain-containing protein
MNSSSSRQISGFTIVELLVVIVVIGVLAAIALVSYTGISGRAVAASLQSDLSSAATQLKAYSVLYGTYPQALDGNNCPTTPTVDSKYCLKPSSGNTFSYSSSSPYTTFSLTVTNSNGTVWRVSDSYPPGQVAPLTAIAAISGTPGVGSILTAGALTPSGATATYQWQSASTSNGTYTNISGATSGTYTPVLGDAGMYLKVVATGTNTYGGSVTSAYVGPVPSPILISGGTITYSGGIRTHTFGPGTYNLTTTASGTITVTINGAGGGGGGGADECNGGGDDGNAGSSSTFTYVGTVATAYGGGAGGGAPDSGSNGSVGTNGGTNTPSGWTTNIGGGSAGGIGGSGAYDDGGHGGAGGKLYKASFSVTSGNSLTVFAGAGGSGGAGGNPCDSWGGDDGGGGIDGSVVISYPY